MLLYIYIYILFIIGPPFKLDHGPLGGGGNIQGKGSVNGEMVMEMENVIKMVGGSIHPVRLRFLSRLLYIYIYI